MNTHKFIKYSKITRYVLFVLTIALSIFTISTIENTISIEQLIKQTEQQTVDKKQQTAFKENFKLNYLSGDYTQYFIAHQHGYTLPGEKRVKITMKNQNQTIEKQETLEIREDRRLLDLKQIDPVSSRYYFVKEHFENYLPIIFEN